MSQESPPPKPGESYRCQACGRETIAKLQKVMDGWRCTGEAVVCAFCKAPVGPPVAAGSGAVADTRAQDAAALRRLSSLLDAKPVAAPRFADMSKGHFCKDCRHFLRHPFNRRCLLHDRPVEPMDDCDDFMAKPPERPDTEKPLADSPSSTPGRP